MLSTPVHTLEQRATVIALLARFQSNDALRVDTPHPLLRPLRQIVTVRGNRVCRRRAPSMLDLAGVDSSTNVPEAGRGWRRGAAWDAIDGRSISERCNAAAAGGTDALGADRQLAEVFQDAVLDVRDVPVLV
jgi:hypothetical protein